ncbi:m7GpppX diphosphatase-like, partial [Pecten maximus]|uniref:m7GpppX diphosphatase-like n=1 Tax=Pecten maximus TaxID=6579 RepID=UPI001458ECE7
GTRLSVGKKVTTVCGKEGHDCLWQRRSRLSVAKKVTTVCGKEGHDSVNHFDLSCNREETCQVRDNKRLLPYVKTKEMYEKCQTPYYRKKLNIQWVYNILDKKSESDRIVFEDACPKDGFILLPDMKWNRKELSQLYLVAIVHTREVLSLRDLNHTHLPCSTISCKRGMEAIRKKFGVKPSKLRMYVHYQPSYHHFHVHFTHLALDAPVSRQTEPIFYRTYRNITIKSDYYPKKYRVQSFENVMDCT